MLFFFVIVHAFVVVERLRANTRQVDAHSGPIVHKQLHSVVQRFAERQGLVQGTTAVFMVNCTRWTTAPKKKKKSGTMHSDRRD